MLPNRPFWRRSRRCRSPRPHSPTATPVNGLINPKLIPGAFANYSLTITAPASTSPTNNSVIATNALPTNLSLFVGTMPPVPARYALRRAAAD